MHKFISEANGCYYKQYENGKVFYVILYFFDFKNIT